MSQAVPVPSGSQRFREPPDLPVSAYPTPYRGDTRRERPGTTPSKPSREPVREPGREPGREPVRHPGLLNTEPSPTRCGQCGAPVWSAVIDGWDTLLDPGDLDTLAEIVQRLRGVRIYQTIPGTNLRQLQHRVHWNINAAQQPAHVLAGHTCTPAPHPPLTSLWPEPAWPIDTEECPF